MPGDNESTSTIRPIRRPMLAEALEAATQTRAEDAKSMDPYYQDFYKNK